MFKPWVGCRADKAVGVGLGETAGLKVAVGSGVGDGVGGSVGLNVGVGEGVNVGEGVEVGVEGGVTVKFIVLTDGPLVTPVRQMQGFSQCGCRRSCQRCL